MPQLVMTSWLATLLLVLAMLSAAFVGSARPADNIERFLAAAEAPTLVLANRKAFEPYRTHLMTSGVLA